jgi:hypothetical protein
MAGERRALLVATDTYTDPGLTQLRAPTGDVEALSRVLEDPAIGGFTVKRVFNAPAVDVKQELSQRSLYERLRTEEHDVNRRRSPL